MRRRVAKKVLRRWLQDQNCGHKWKTLHRAYKTLGGSNGCRSVIDNWLGHGVVEVYTQSVVSWKESVEGI